MKTITISSYWVGQDLEYVIHTREDWKKIEAILNEYITLTNLTPTIPEELSFDKIINKR